MTAALRSRRELTLAVLVCAAGAGLALWAGSRTWVVDVAARPAPLGPVSTDRTGGSLLPALPAVTLVVLAGGGALLATRGWGRRIVGALIAFGGLAVVALSLSALDRAGIAGGWVALTVVGGVCAAAAGGYAAVRGSDWPGLGRRYERPAASTVRTRETDSPVSDGTGSGDGSSREYWEALDRGEDPTSS